MTNVEQLFNTPSHDDRKIDVDRAFAEFWARYPRKRSRLDARKAYGQAIKLVSPDQILAGVERLRRNLPSETRFIPYPATWLRAGGWLDEDEGPASPIDFAAAAEDER